MFITKGEIESINYENSTCNVRVPIFESAGNSNKVSLLALISTPPCEDFGYLPNDIVFVAFAENSLNKPVVLGKLLTPAKYKTNKPTGKVSCESLEVTDSASLPVTTSIVSTGAYDNTAFRSIQDLIDQVKQQKQQIDVLTQKIEDLTALINKE